MHERMTDADGRKVTEPHPPVRSEAEHSPLRHLETQAGNQAVARALGGSGGLSAGLRGLPSSDGQLEPALDRTVEREADQVADRAVGRMGARPAPSVTAPGGVPSALAAAMAPDVGSVSNVRFEDSPAAHAQAGSMGARAFTRGSTVSFGRGELDLGRPQGIHLAAHETAHAALHPSPGGAMVHAKLRGTSDALLTMGGQRSSSKFWQRGLLKTNWDKIIEGVNAYEALEAALVKGGQPAPQALAAARPRMLKTLAAIEAACVAWQAANGGGAAETQSEQWHESFKQTGSMQQTDDRSKAPRRQAVALLLPRIQTEMADVAAGQWSRTLGLSDAQLTGTGRTDAGQMNTVQELKYVTESGQFSGFFKTDKGFDSKMAGHDIDVGIHQADPNYSARAMAMYRLDQLLGAGVTARVEFAVHDGKMGHVLESAQGQRGAGAAVGLSKGQSQAMGGSSFSVDDSTLQSCLNKLQILDAIAGQLDRHGGNYFIQSEGGKVTGVTGIDLDMAFGKDMRTHDDRSSKAATNYKGMPALIDAEFGRRILTVSESDIRAALGGLLSREEVDATVSRLESVKEYVRTAQATGQLVDNWDETTARSGKSFTDLKFAGDRKTYGEDMAYAALIRVGNDVQEMLGPMINSRLGNDLHPKAVQMFQFALRGEGESRGLISVATQRLCYERQIDPANYMEFAEDLTETYLGDNSLRTQAEIWLQECGDASPTDFRNEIKDVIARLTAQVAARHARVPVRA